MRVLTIILTVISAGLASAANAADAPPRDGRFFGTYCGEAVVRYEVTPTFLGIKGSPHTETVRATVTARLGHVIGSGGRGLLHGKGVAHAPSGEIPFALSGKILAPGVARSVLWSPALGTGQGVLRLLEGGDRLEVQGLGQKFELTKECDNSRPTIEIVSPVPGARFPWGHQVSLAARVTDVEDVAFPRTRLVWSSDRDGELGFGYGLEASYLSQGVHRITLVATDSGGRSSSAEVLVAIRNNPPETPLIVSPTDGTSYPSSTLVFRGRAGDRESGRIEGEDLLWTSGRDGRIGVGEHLSGTLSPGEHQVTLTATDPGGDTSSASVRIEVTSCAGDCPPQVLIRSPEDFIAIADTSCVTVVAAADDPEEGLLSSGSFTWSTTYFDGVGPTTESIAGSGPAVEICGLATSGVDTVHTISVTATDGDGNSSVPDSIRIYVIFGGLI